MRMIVLGALALLAGCAGAENYGDAPLDRRSGGTQYRIDENRDGSFGVSIRQEVYQFVPQTSLVWDNCRREAVAIAREEARQRGGRFTVDEASARLSMGRNALTGTTSCTAAVTAVPTL